MYYFIGSDPDLHKPNAVSVGTEDFKTFGLERVFMVNAKGNGCDAVTALNRQLLEANPQTELTSHYRAVAIEEVEVVTSSRRGANPQSMIPLAHSAGAMSLWLSFLSDNVWFVRPQGWKGSQPKKINQARTCAALGLEYKIMGGKSPYCCPLGLPERFQSINDSDWKHLLDSAGLAIWAAKTWKAKHGDSAGKV